jgi:UDP-N-acetylmuramate--alanine ligase
VTSETIADELTNGHFIPNFLEASEWMIAQAKPGDVIVTLGAGDVNSLAPIISDGLARRFNQ